MNPALVEAATYAQMALNADGRGGESFLRFSQTLKENTSEDLTGYLWLIGGILVAAGAIFGLIARWGTHNVRGASDQPTQFARDVLAEHPSSVGLPGLMVKEYRADCQENQMPSHIVIGSKGSAGEHFSVEKFTPLN